MKGRNMPQYLADVISKHRSLLDLTQDEYGGKYGVSGPAIFKFEKGYVSPSLELWLAMSADAGISERRAVLLWVKSRLPEEYQEHVELQGAASSDDARPKKKSATKPSQDYSKLKGRQQILDLVHRDHHLPDGLKRLVGNDELWGLYKPTGLELQMLVEIFKPLGQGTMEHYRQALCLIREFSER